MVNISDTHDFAGSGMTFLKTCRHKAEHDMPGRAFPTALSALLAGCVAVVLPVGAHNAAQAQSTTTSPLTAQTAVAPVSDAIVTPGANKVHAGPAQAGRPLDAESLGPDLNAIRRPPNTPIPPSGVPVLPFPGMATMSVQPVGPSGDASAFHKVELDSILATEGPSRMLPPNLDALRDTDLNDPYYVPTAGSGALIPQLSPFRNRLREKGFTFSFTYKGEANGLFAGGRPGEKGTSYVHELTLQAIFDLGKMDPRLGGWSVHTLVMERAGKAIQGPRVGESYVGLQEVYSLSGNVVAHLVDLYAEKKFRNNTLDVIFGRMSLTHVFATSPLLCSFMVTCSAPVAIKQNPGMSVYPKATWGARIRFRPTWDTAIQIGAYSVGALNENPSGWAWGAEHATGISLPIEFTWQPFLTRNRLPGHYVLGYAHDTTRYADKIGSALPSAVAAQVPGARSAPSDMFWLEADQMVYRLGGRNMMAGGYLMGGYIHVTPRAVNVSDQLYGGISLVGVIPSRMTDRLGMMFSWYKVSNRRRQSEQLALDGGYGLPSGVYGVQHSSDVIEAYYGIDALPGLLVQPEFQYMIHPGETHKIRNAGMMDLKVIANL
ncbi:carbohydrate porin [Acetobacter pasteurianus]|uniref:carbohydrate porin n=1 Tax=Acetobacter pasteurianus TaxID=438 RepID=UPI000F56D9E9|nr:carbohydrate porin [Acetobacter pasteurianus]